MSEVEWQEEQIQRADNTRFAITSKTLNVIARNSFLNGPQNIVCVGRCVLQEKCVLRGDLGKISMGKFCFVSSSAVLHPSSKVFGAELKFLPLTVGDYVSFGEGCVVKAASVGSYVRIGANAVIGERSIVKDCCEIREGCVIPADTVVPPFTCWSGNPGKMEGQLPEGVWKKIEWEAEQLFSKVAPK